MPNPVTLHQTEDHPIHSEQVGADFRLWIAPPVAGFAPTSSPPTILWVLDGDLYFATAVELTRLMHRLYGELPPLLVVGVAYGSDDPADQAELRNRDLTPTADPSIEAMARQFDPDRAPLLPEGQRMGGAAAFLRFLLEEARPYVRSRFTVGDGETLFGSSLAGLFGIWAAVTEPAAFDRVIAISPALWWHDDHVIRLEAELAATRDDLPTRLYLGVGSLEEPEDMPFVARYRLISNVRTLADRLAQRAYPSLELHTAVIEGETHTSVVPVGLTRGLRVFFHQAPAGERRQR